MTAAWSPCSDCDNRQGDISVIDCDGRETLICLGCAGRRERGEPRKVELDRRAAIERRPGSRFVWYMGAHSAELA